MAYGDRTKCRACGREIIQIGGGHRQRAYCDDSCKQRAYQARKEQARLTLLRSRWQRFTVLTQDFLIGLTLPGDDHLAGRIAEALDREVEAERLRQSSTLATHDVSDLKRHPPGG
jgi:hypothetical protein